ncbi:hypothetical protein [Gordonia sp. 852002-50395_SCH5434458]|uniref:hypothetical protein n=1 Tax=Gordonia sp. 852002-50395_SCH5434458 TaxID=1834090 RepID=UPI0007EBBDCA|nr:hypothetical protein [Gordonia sp. 852002-50395_SCH5434458]OBC01738.1 hypothetical protein A5785_17215 [Gordonia sp. 852002-50395_SCH5434458]
MNLNKITAAVAGIAAAGAIALGAVTAATASAQPFLPSGVGCFDAVREIPNPVSPLGNPIAAIPTGRVVITDQTVSLNGARGTLHRTPNADFASATATIPGIGPVAVLADSPEPSLAIGGHANSPESISHLTLHRVYC